MNRRLAAAVVALALASAASVGLLRAAAPESPAQAPTDDLKTYLPLTLRGMTRADLVPPAAVTPLVNPSATPTRAAATPTDEPTSVPPTPTPEPATDTPEPPTATPTEEPAKGRILGRYTVAGEPLPPGYGTEGLPQIELHRCTGAECVKVANAVSANGGTFEFLGPAPLSAGEWYQVVWLNTDPITGREWVYDWRSRRITEFTGAEEIDLGPMEIGNLLLREPCNDCHQTLPITYKWDTRDNTRDVYRWSLINQCGDPTLRVNAWQSQPLGHRDTFTLSSPPPGFRLDTRYCWFVYIEDGTRGTGTSYEQYVTAFLTPPR